MTDKSGGGREEIDLEGASKQRGGGTRETKRREKNGQKKIGGELEIMRGG